MNILEYRGLPVITIIFSHAVLVAEGKSPSVKSRSVYLLRYTALLSALVEWFDLKLIFLFGINSRLQTFSMNGGYLYSSIYILFPNISRYCSSLFVFAFNTVKNFDLFSLKICRLEILLFPLDVCLLWIH